ncbi:MAG: thioredoxin family protein [Candidatus Wallbacteria bacterium]|nr:thioredoxin family protein [Candidatus Wallbacteria bacterium]
MKNIGVICLVLVFMSLNTACSQNAGGKTKGATKETAVISAAAGVTGEAKVVEASPVPAETAEVLSGMQIKKAEKLPRLLDLGAGSCIPCKMMAPILDKLESDFAGKLDVKFIDVWKNQAEARKYGVQAIPTQIFYDATGRELFRHTGFYAREEILKKWKELGFEFSEQ